MVNLFFTFCFPATTWHLFELNPIYNKWISFNATLVHEGWRIHKGHRMLSHRYFLFVAYLGREYQSESLTLPDAGEHIFW